MNLCSRSCLAWITCLLVSSQAAMATSASNSTLNFDFSTNKPLVTFTLGADFVQPGQAQSLTLLPPFQNYYTNTSGSTTAADGGIFVGIERAFNPRIQAQLGVSGYIDEQITPQGNIWQFGLPQFENLAYQYNVHSNRLMLEGKALTILGQSHVLHPYFSWGAGAAFNRASGYQETPLVAGAVPMAAFASNSQTSFTWALGIGTDYDIYPHVRLGLGYQFADLGSASLGPSPAATTNQTLSFAHLYANQARLQLTYIG